jgi:hypothetical protein
MFHRHEGAKSSALHATKQAFSANESIGANIVLVQGEKSALICHQDEP